MLVITVEAASQRWAGRRHDDDRPDAISGTAPAALFDAVFVALHDGEQVALGFDSPLTMPAPSDQATPGPQHPDALADRAAAAAARPGIAELGHVLGELGSWRPWTTVSTSLSRWKANTSILVFQAVAAEGSGEVEAGAAVDSFFRQYQRPTGPGTELVAGPVVNLAAATARQAGLFVDASELDQPPLSVTVTSS